MWLILVKLILTPEQSETFEELVAQLPKTEEWIYLNWEVDIRLTKMV